MKDGKDKKPKWWVTLAAFAAWIGWAGIFAAWGIIFAAAGLCIAIGAAAFGILGIRLNGKGKD